MNKFREATNDEIKSTEEYIKSISKPTGNNFYENGTNITLTKDELDSIKYALSIAQLQLNYKAVNSAMWGNVKASEAYKEQSQKMEKLLEDLKDIKEN